MTRIRRVPMEDNTHVGKIWVPNTLTFEQSLYDMISPYNYACYNISEEFVFQLFEPYQVTTRVNEQNIIYFSFIGMDEETGEPVNLGSSYKTTDGGYTWTLLAYTNNINTDNVYPSLDGEGYYFEVRNATGHDLWYIDDLSNTGGYVVEFHKCNPSTTNTYHKSVASSFNELSSFTAIENTYGEALNPFKTILFTEVEEPDPTPVQPTVASTFTDIANSIRTKLGTSEGIRPDEMADLILTISGENE